MSKRIVVVLGVHNLGYRFVGHELSGRERDGHAEGCRVRDVESLETFVSINGPCTLRKCLMNGAMDLHALFDHCCQVNSWS